MCSRRISSNSTLLFRLRLHQPGKNTQFVEIVELIVVVVFVIVVVVVAVAAAAAVTVVVSSSG